MVRTIWIVRHAEREDNINVGWMETDNPLKLKADNSPLSKRGRRQAGELAKRFADIPIDHIFASPFERTVETASILIGDRGIPIKAEPGLAEALYLCENPPSFEEPAQLRKRYPLVDPNYEPVYRKPMPREGYGDEQCLPRVRKTLEEILRRYKDAKSILLVSHGSPIGALHEILRGDWNYVGQATVSKFVAKEDGKGGFRCEFTCDASHLSDKKNLRAY